MANNNLFQQAKNAVNRITNGQNISEQDKQVARTAIQSAYTSASPEEQQELQQLEQQLEQRNELK